MKGGISRPKLRWIFFTATGWREGPTLGVCIQRKNLPTYSRPGNIAPPPLSRFRITSPSHYNLFNESSWLGDRNEIFSRPLIVASPNRNEKPRKTPVTLFVLRVVVCMKTASPNINFDLLLFLEKTRWNGAALCPIVTATIWHLRVQKSEMCLFDWAEKIKTTMTIHYLRTELC